MLQALLLADAAPARSCPTFPAIVSDGCVAPATDHLIDRMWTRGQLVDWQHELAGRLLDLCGDAGLLPSPAAPIGRIGRAAEMPDDMAEARARWNRAMRQVGGQGADVLTDLCHERHPGGRIGALHTALEVLRVIFTD